MKTKEIVEELRLVFKGKSVDTIIPPLVFVIMNRLFDLQIALIVSVSLAFCFFLLRIVKKQTFGYALAGVGGIFLASFLAFIAENANNFFLPGIIGNGIIVLVGTLSLIFKKPMAAYASHLTRNWPLDWFWRKDVYPAYKEVTIFWISFFFIRTILETYLYLNATPEVLAWAEIVLGLPITIMILVFSYVYGIWRLKALEGPGVDEYIEGKEPPYKGQTRGF